MNGKIILSSILACSSVALMGSEKPKNILFILVDDYGWKDVSYNGSSFYETPNIDALAGSGMVFTNGYAAASISSPTRCSIMSGKYPARLNITDWIKGYQHGLNEQQLSKYKMIAPQFCYNMPLEEKTIAETMKERGYSTYFVGKWHCSEDEAFYPEHQGFDQNIGGWGSGSPTGSRKEGGAYLSPYNNPRLKDGPKGEYLCDRMGDEAINLIESSKDNPFFLYLSFYSVHTPIHPKPEKSAYFRQKAKDMGLDTLSGLSTNYSLFANQDFRAKHWVERNVQNSADYAALISSMDDNVGKVLDKLKELGLDKNTIICFTSDNGGLSTAESSPTCNAPLKAGKGWLYEGGIRVPYIIRIPNVTKSGSVCDVPVVSTDFYPTILQACGLPLQEDQHVDGKSLLPLIQGRKLDRKSIYWHYPHYGGKGDAPHGAIRSGDWKLIEFFETGKVELYNLRKDISETKDLSAENKKITKELVDELHRWRESVDAKMPVVNNNYLKQ